MTVKELRESLSNIPDDATVFIECDHGQDKEYVGCIIESRSDLESDPDSMIFEYDNWEKHYDEEDVKEYDENGKVTAVLISY